MDVYNMRTVVALLILVASFGPARAADSTLVVHAEVRVRGETDGRDFNNKTPLLSYTFLRTRLGVELRPSSNVSAIIQVQDSRRFGGGSPVTLIPRGGMGAPDMIMTMTPQAENLDLHQGFLRLEELFIEGLSVQLGRMELSYGSERLVGASEWDNVGRAFDAVKFQYVQGGHTVDLFTAKIVGTVVPMPVTPWSVSQAPDQGFLFSGLWYEPPALPSVRLAAYFFHEWFKQDDLLSRGTVGLFAEASSGDFLVDGELAYQGGERWYTGISAFMAAGSVGLAFGDGRGGVVRAGYQYLSGSDDGDLTYHTFEPVFHSGHDLAGTMDYFAIPAFATNERGLQDLFLRVQPGSSARITVTITLHHFLLARPWSGNRGLGQELDVTGRYSSWKNATLEFCVSAFNPNEVMKAWYNNRDVAFWGSLGARVWLP